MIAIVIVAVVAGLVLAPAARRLVPPSPGTLGSGPIENYIGIALAIAVMLTITGGAIYGIVGLISG